MILPDKMADVDISIHAPHTGRDTGHQLFLASFQREISIHAPHTGRDLMNQLK